MFYSILLLALVVSITLLAVVVGDAIAFIHDIRAWWRTRRFLIDLKDYQARIDAYLYICSIFPQPYVLDALEDPLVLAELELDPCWQHGDDPQAYIETEPELPAFAVAILPSTSLLPTTTMIEGLGSFTVAANLWFGIQRLVQESDDLR